MNKEEKQQAFANWWFNLPQKEVVDKKKQIMERFLLKKLKT